MVHFFESLLNFNLDAAKIFRLYSYLYIISMHHWNEYPFVRILLPFLAGLLTCVFTPLHLPFFLLPCLLLVVMLLHFSTKNKTFRLYKYAAWLGCCFQLSIFTAGNILAHQRIDAYHQEQFVHHLQQADFFRVIITEPPVEKERTYKAVISVVEMNSHESMMPVAGRSVLYLEKNEQSATLQYGDVLLVKNSFQLVAGPANPDQFDYKEYLWYREIYATAFLQSDDWMKLSSGSGNFLIAFTFRLRDLSLQAIQKHISSAREAGVVEALVIGYRDHMLAETTQSYTAAGVVHVLAVSGLHVAILFALLHQLLFFLNRKKHGKAIQSIVILSAIWIFTLVTGLSGSVLRAAAMFSFITIGKNMKRPVNLFNILSCSAFAILLADPLLVMDVGFQLSYLAVTGIGTLNKYIDQWLPRENKIIDFLWKMMAMSLAAQIATFPLTTFYFHQFPLYFLPANIVVIPAAGIILHLGLAIIALQFIPVLATLTGEAAQWITYIMNEFILRIQSLPAAIIHLAGTDFTQMLLTGALIIFISRYFITRSRNWMFATAVSFVFLLTLHCIHACSIFGQHSFTVYAFKKTGVLEFRSQNEAVMYQAAGSISGGDSLYLVQHWRLHQITPATSSHTTGAISEKVISAISPDCSFFQFYNYKIALVNRPLPANKTGSRLKVDALLISGNPSISMHDLTNYFETTAIIFDGSNNSYKVSKWQREAEELGMATHDVMKDGAYIRHI